MIAVLGSFRLPLASLARARPLMAAVIADSVAEPGCRQYSYAEDVAEPGLFRVIEMWDTREALEAHFATGHMTRWSQQRATLGFYDRSIAAYEVGAPDIL